MTISSITRKAGVLAVAMAVALWCGLFSAVPSAFADAVAHLDYYQKFDSNTTNDKIPIHYRLIPVDNPNTPEDDSLTNPMPEGSVDRVYDFVLLGGDKNDVEQYPSGVYPDGNKWKTIIDISYTEPGDYYYKAFCVEESHKGYEYGFDKLPFDASEGTEFDVIVHVTEDALAGKSLVTFTSKYGVGEDGKSYDPGWQTRHRISSVNENTNANDNANNNNAIDERPDGNKGTGSDSKTFSSDDGKQSPKLGEIIVPIAILIIPAIGLIILVLAKRRQDDDDDDDIIIPMN